MIVTNRHPLQSLCLCPPGNTRAEMSIEVRLLCLMFVLLLFSFFLLQFLLVASFGSFLYFSICPFCRSDLQLTAEMYNHLRGLQKKAKDLRQEVRNLRRMSQTQAHTVRETLRDAFLKIRQGRRDFGCIPIQFCANRLKFCQRFMVPKV